MTAQTLPMPITGPLTPAQLTRLVNLIRRAARAEILPRFRQLDPGQIDTKTGPDDLVTVADTAAEAMITRGLQMAFPAALIVGEESVAKNPDLVDQIAEAELCFLVDPVDGTWNFAHGLGVFGTIIAMCRFGRPVLGLIYDPLSDDVAVCDIEEPSVMRSPKGTVRRLHTAAPKPLDMLQGYAHLNLMPHADRVLASARATRLNMVSGLRCSAHEYRLLAQGAVDFVLSSKLNPWDHAAGSLLCQQAGGHSAMLDGRAYSAAIQSGFLLSASSQQTWDLLADLFGDLLSND